ncbi:MAG: P pilus assembly/Cpx signaling pathway, periplasmic inhibitor/zinc-resistance associated protein [Mastigocoleus sp. MO_167.B18]|nr:P pilus assembly/Cpx signaling pathway, periplasmic inhibitor/zinc-resistance associated protein [Mastigocoleus sp. MO_167.B18]
MTLKRLSLITTVVTLTIGTTSLLAKAENNTSKLNQLPILVAQVQTEIPPRFEKLNLTDKQKSQMTEIIQQGREDIEEILTPEQKQKFKRTIANGQRNRKAMRSLNLNEEQKDQIREIMESQRSEVEAILTDEQKQQLQELRPNFQRSGRRFNR